MINGVASIFKTDNGAIMRVIGAKNVPESNINSEFKVEVCGKFHTNSVWTAVLT